MIVGFVAAKANSNRFPGKNIAKQGGIPLFYHSVKPMLESKRIDEVYVITDSNYIKEYCEKRKVKVIWRPKNATRDEDKLISVLRYGYYNLNNAYDIVVSIMANCPGHTSEDIDKGIKKLQKNNLKEVRSFNSNGEENGIMILHKDIIEDNRDISYYIGSIETIAKEIHYKKELGI
jgi:CMP-N-acetylneuraminic acid synthetase